MALDKYRIRRAILEAVDASEPGLATLDDVACYPLLRMAGTPAAVLTDECRDLARHGYMIDGRPGRAPLYKLSAKGRDQLNQEADLDEYVWGEMASKFQQ